MAFAFNVNVAASGASDLIRNRILLFTIKALLVANGWTVEGCSTGSGGAFNNTGTDLWTVATDIIANGAWCRLQHTATGVEIILTFRATVGAEENLGLLWSRAAGFTGGAPSTTVPPTATDEVEVADRTTTHCVAPTVNYQFTVLCDDSTPTFLAFAGESANDIRFVYGLDWLTDVKTGDTLPGIGWAMGSTSFRIEDLYGASDVGGGYDVDNATVRNRGGANGFKLVDYRDVGGNNDVFDQLTTQDPRTNNVTSVEILVYAGDVPNRHIKGVSALFRQVPSTMALFDDLTVSPGVGNDRWILSGTSGNSVSVIGDGATTPAV